MTSDKWSNWNQISITPIALLWAFASGYLLQPIAFGRATNLDEGTFFAATVCVFAAGCSAASSALAMFAGRSAHPLAYFNFTIAVCAGLFTFAILGKIAGY